MRSTISKFTQISICSVILAFVLIINVLAGSKKLDASGQVRTTIKATHKNPVVVEKSGYKNFQTVK